MPFFLTFDQWKSLVNALLDENSELAAVLPVSEACDGDTDQCCEKLLGRRQKSEADFTHHVHTTNFVGE